ncbi:8-amino-7-oxononanoate synthase [Gilvimarinus sp. F26214L]
MEAALAERQGLNRYRRRRTLQSPQSAALQVDGRSVLAFCSNDYLALADHPRIVAAFRTAAARYGVGSGASHLICGHSAEHHQLEEELADFTGRERALLVSTGYMANLGAINALTDADSAVFMDRLNHASLWDGAFVSRAQVHKFPHNNLLALEAQLAACQSRNKLIAVDGVYSMDGDMAPLPQLAGLARTHDAALMVDDAHGFGWLGDSGAGVCEHYGLGQAEVPVLMGTLGKSLGCFGAFLAGSEALIEALIQLCRPYVYSTALPPAVAAATREALAVIRDEPERRDRLRALVRRFRAAAQERSIPLTDSETPIQPVVTGDEARTLALAGDLLERGFWVGAIRPPTVPEGGSRLRISLRADHGFAQVDSLLDALKAGLERN